MIKIKLLIIILFISKTPLAQELNQDFISNDIDNFWIAYNKINSTEDTVKQYKFLKELYIDKATPGLKSLIEVRNYTEREMLGWITKYPKFWSSLKPNTLNVKSLYPEIESDIKKLKRLYPSLKPATIYFTIGAFRTNGTTQGDRVLIGSELSLADKNVIVNEFPAWRQQFYKLQNPIAELSLLCAHEYVHTQQKARVENLLSSCLYEGVAEFVSCLATGKKSAANAIEFGKANEKMVVDKFVADLFLMTNDYNWLWGENTNQFKVRDLGYYIGYEICERYYSLSQDKLKAIKELIELDYGNEKEVERIVDLTQLLPKSLEEIYNDYDKQRPTIVGIAPFTNGTELAKPGLRKITITFSEPMVMYNTGIDFGPLGEDYFPTIKPERVFGEDGKTWTFEAELLPNKHYQILISNNFRKENGVRLKPYLIDFKTTE